MTKHGHYDEYDEFLQPYAERYLSQVKWSCALPYLVRIILRRYIEGLPDAFSASCFVCRNYGHTISLELRKYYKLSFEKEYNILGAGYCERVEKWNEINEHKTN